MWKYGHVVACVAAGLVPWWSVTPESRGTEAFPGWPTVWEGRTLRPLTLTAREERFTRGFPGRVGRFSDGQREIILRWVNRSTRQLHPASDCFRGSGYEIASLPLVQDGEGRRWGAFAASRDGVRLRVRERVSDGQNGAWTDVSAWYWAALLGRTHGPWWAVTVAEREGG